MNKSFYHWGSALVGVAFVVAGLIMGYLGWHSRTEITDNLIAENLNVQDPAILLTYEGARAPEGVEVPMVLVDTAAKADLEAQVIHTHVLGITGGQTYTELDREDPGRATYVTALTLQTALHLAHSGLELSLFVIGVGVAFTGLGLSILVLGLPLIRKVLALK